MLLQIMEEGHLTDSFGRRVDFKNVILIMTTEKMLVPAKWLMAAVWVCIRCVNGTRKNLMTT